MSPVVEEELLLHVPLLRPLEQSLGIPSCIPPGTRPYRTFQTTILTPFGILFKKYPSQMYHRRYVQLAL